MNLVKLSIWLLLISGIILFIPGMYTWLTLFTKNYPWIQVFLGLLSIVVSGTMLIKKIYVPKK